MALLKEELRVLRDFGQVADINLERSARIQRRIEAAAKYSPPAIRQVALKVAPTYLFTDLISRVRATDAEHEVNESNVPVLPKRF
jgi:hypothetical protein